MENSVSARHELERIGERVASIRLAQNLTQTQLADLSGISRNTVRRLEAGDVVSFETFIGQMPVH